MGPDASVTVHFRLEALPSIWGCSVSWYGNGEFSLVSFRWLFRFWIWSILDSRRLSALSLVRLFSLVYWYHTISASASLSAEQPHLMYKYTDYFVLKQSAPGTANMPRLLVGERGFRVPMLGDGGQVVFVQTVEPWTRREMCAYNKLLLVEGPTATGPFMLIN